MTLFDDSERSDLSARRRNQPLFEYYNLTARRPFGLVRELLESWFSRFPETERTELRARFRSGNDGGFHSAFFELYIHELLPSVIG